LRYNLLYPKPILIIFGRNVAKGLYNVLVSMHSCGACTNTVLCTRLLTLNTCWLQAIVNCLEICKSANIVLITYSLHARTTLLHALRPAGHEFLLPICNYELHRRSFVVRCCYEIQYMWTARSTETETDWTGWIRYVRCQVAH